MREKGKKNIAASVRQKLINLSKARGEDPNLVFIRYAVERFLYRVSQSGYSDRFVLKGAMLLAIWAGKPHRPTKDLDLLGFGDSSEAAVQRVFREICGTVVEPDGIDFDPASVQVAAIRGDLEYPGQRVRLESRLGNARLNIQIDVGFGDSVVPEPVEIEYPTLLDMPVARIRAYPPEAVVSEKFKAIASRGILNSRMKDFYDLMTMAKEFEFDGSVLAEAIKATFVRRGTAIGAAAPVALTREFSGDREKQRQWQAFIRTSGLEDRGLELSQAIEEIYEFLVPVVVAVANGSPFKKRWREGGPWR